MIEPLTIALRPVGVVRSTMQRLDDVPIPGKPAQVEIFPTYRPALHRIEENSHLWLLLWFHQSERGVLRTAPKRMDPNLDEFGVFGLRSPNRPNPIALTLVQLQEVRDNVLLITGLDAIDGTPVLDIKSYYEQDIIFSPRTPYIRAQNPFMRRDIFLRHALNHHQEECPDLLMAVRMALVADEFMGHLNRPDLRVEVSGSACLADAIQGLTQARLANPPRFAYQLAETLPESTWSAPSRTLKLAARWRLNQETFSSMRDEDLFEIEVHDIGV